MTIEFLLIIAVAAGLFSILEITTSRVAANMKPRPVPVRIDEDKKRRK